MDETALISRKAGRIQSDGKRKVPDKRRGVLKLWMVRDTWLCAVRLVRRAAPKSLWCRKGLSA